MRKTKYPKIESNWQTGNKRSKIMGGSNTLHDDQIRALRHDLIRDVSSQITNGDREEAKALVEQHLIGMRTSNAHAMAASPDAQRLLPERKQYPPLEPEWQTASMRKIALGGDNRVHDANMRVLRRQLVDDVADYVTQGDLDEAEAFVDKHLAGMRQPSKGQAAMAVSPEAQRLLPNHIPLEPDWQTGNMRKQAIGGNHRRHTANMHALRKELIADVAESVTRGNSEEAEALVDQNVVGERKPRKGPATIAAGPDAQAILDNPENGWVRRYRRSSKKQEALLTR